MGNMLNLLLPLVNRFFENSWLLVVCMICFPHVAHCVTVSVRIRGTVIAHVLHALTLTDNTHPNSLKPDLLPIHKRQKSLDDQILAKKARSIPG